jgi:hypothetical protein
VVDRARVGSYLRLRGLAEDGVREGAKGVGRRRAVRGAVVLARDEVAHRHLRCLLRRTGPLADAGWVVTRALLRPPATKEQSAGGGGGWTGGGEEGRFAGMDYGEQCSVRPDKRERTGHVKD